MRPTLADLKLWQHYKRPAFAASLLKQRPSIHDAISARANPKHSRRTSAYANTLALLILARRNYARCARLPDDPLTFRDYVSYLAQRGDAPERRAYCARIVRKLQRS